MTEEEIELMFLSAIGGFLSGMACILMWIACNQTPDEYQPLYTARMER